MPDPNFDLSRVRSGPIHLSEERELEKTEHRSIDHECVLCKDDPASPAEYPSGLRGRIANPLFVGSNPTSAFVPPSQAHPEPQIHGVRHRTAIRGPKLLISDDVRRVTAELAAPGGKQLRQIRPADKSVTGEVVV